MMKKWLWISAVLLLSCGAKQATGDPIENRADATPIQFVKACEGNDDPTCDCDDPGEQLKIKGVELAEEGLYIQTEYYGGCTEHSFKLSACNNVLISDPPQQDFVLVHDDHRDMCDGVAGQTLLVPAEQLPAIKLGKTRDQTIRVTLLVE